MSARRNNLGVPEMQVPKHFVDNLGSGDEVDNTTTISIQKIVISSAQPRRYFDATKQQQLNASIKEHGILEPLIVRPAKNERNVYELVAGERRFRAAKELDFEEVPVVIKKLEDNQARQIALIENLQREDLNPIEETEGILELLKIELNLSDTSEVVSIIDHVLNSKRHNLEVTENVFSNYQKIEAIMAITSKLSPESFRTSRLPLLNLPSDVLDYLRQGKIEYTKARAIARIKEESKRKALLKEACENNLSLNQIKDKIKELKSASSPSTKKDQAYSQRINDIYQKVKKIKSWDDENKKKEFEKLLEKLEELF